MDWINQCSTNIFGAWLQHLTTGLRCCKLSTNVCDWAMLNHSGSTIDRLKIIVKWGTFHPWRTLGHVTCGQGGHKTLTTANSNQSRLLRLKNGIPQGPFWYPSLHHLRLWPDNHRLQKVCIHRRPSNHACWWRLIYSGRVLSKDMATVVEDLRTWKLKLSATKTGLPAFHINTKEAKRQLQHQNPAVLFRAHMPWSKVGQDTHVPQTPRVTSQKVDITRCILEMTCWLWLGCWSNNVTNSHLSPGPFNSRVLRSCLVPQCSQPPHWPRHQQRLAKCDLIPAPYTSGQSSFPRKHPTCHASLQRSHTVSSTPSHGTCRSSPHSIVHQMGMHGIWNRDTHSYLLHNTLVHLTTLTEVRHAGRITDGMRKGWRALQDSVLPSLTHPPGMALPRTAWSGSTASEPVTDISAPVCMNGVRPLLRLVSAAKKIESLIMLSSNVQSMARPSNGLHGLMVLDDETIKWLFNTCPEI